MHASDVVHVNPETIELLELAFYALPIGRQKAIEKDIRDNGTPRSQAIFNEIADTRIRMYAEQAQQMKDEEISKALHTLRVLGLNEDQIGKKLKRSK